MPKSLKSVHANDTFEMYTLHYSHNIFSETGIPNGRVTNLIEMTHKSCTAVYQYQSREDSHANYGFSNLGTGTFRYNLLTTYLELYQFKKT